MAASNLRGVGPDERRSLADRSEVFAAVVAIVPAAVAYYIGWAYLYYYLAAFGISSSELDLGIETIFIYAWPPIKILVSSYWYVGVGLFALLASLRWLDKRYGLALGASLSRLRLNIGQASLVAQGLYLFVTLILIAFLLTPLIQLAAARQADQKWEYDGILIQALLSESDRKLAQHANYRLCSERRALDLIIADRDSYYMLCKSAINQVNAAVYEVRREFGLTSVRIITRER